MKKLNLILGLALVGAALAACGGEKPSDTGTATEDLSGMFLRSFVVTTGQTTGQTSVCYEEVVSVGDSVKAPAGTTKTAINNCHMAIATGANYSVMPPNNTTAVILGSFAAGPWICDIKNLIASAPPSSAPNYNFFVNYMDGILPYAPTDFSTFIGYEGEEFGGTGVCTFSGDPNHYNIFSIKLLNGHGDGSNLLSAPTATTNYVYFEISIDDGPGGMSQPHDRLYFLSNTHSP
jgi:hypothetical protein